MRNVLSSLLVLLLLVFCHGVAAQRVTNVTAEQQGQALVIGYALDAEGPAEVQLFLSTDRGRIWDGPLKSCTGDLGKEVKPGTGKRIRWEVLQDRELVSDGVQFKVVAKANAPETADAVACEAAAAANAALLESLDETSAMAKKPWLNSNLTYGSVRDIDGNTYATIRIGKQVWMAENLRTTRYRDGTAIPNVTNNDAWLRLNSGAWCNYDNKPSYDVTYGKLYNWHATSDRRGLCPKGWHVPTDAEWKTLETTLGMPVNELNDDNQRGTAPKVGGKLKASTLWEYPNAGATNVSGFSGLPSGYRNYVGTFTVSGYDTIGYEGEWWSASEWDEDFAWSRSLGSGNAGIYRSGNKIKKYGFCIRCLKD